MKRRAIVAGVVALVAAVAIPARGQTGATVTKASGGEAISADTAGGSYTTLGDLSVQEGGAGDIGMGTLKLDAPAGFEFGPGPVTATAAPTGQNSFTISAGPSCANAAKTATLIPSPGSLTLRICAESSKKTKLTFSGLTVRPERGTPLASGSITQDTAVAGAAVIRGVDASTSWGDLTEVPGAPASLRVEPTGSTITAGTSVTFSVKSVDQFGNVVGPVSDATLSGSDGVTCTAYTCTFTQAGPATVTATKGALTGTATLEVTAGEPVSLSLSPASATIAAGGSQAYEVSGEDAYGNPIPAVQGATLSFSGPEDGTCDGYTCAPTKAGTYTVTAALGGATGTATLEVTAGEPASVVVTANPTRVRPSPLPGNTAAITVTVTDAFGNPVAGAHVSLSVAGGSGLPLPGLQPVVTPSSATTDENGVVTATYTAGPLPGTDTVTATVGSASGSATVTVGLP
jgi:hypothetical protein